MWLDIQKKVLTNMYVTTSVFVPDRQQNIVFYVPSIFKTKQQSEDAI